MNKDKVDLEMEQTIIDNVESQLMIIIVFKKADNYDLDISGKLYRDECCVVIHKRLLCLLLSIM
jgi:hypothetical protein